VATRAALAETAGERGHATPVGATA
jgi:hypothetical protein